MKNVSTGTIVRTACLVLALANNVLTVIGKSPIPLDDEALTQVLSLLLTTAASLAAWWKNNSFTQSAIEADEVLASNKAQ